MKFRAAFNPNHGKDGKFSGKGGAGGGGGAAGGGAAGGGGGSLPSGVDTARDVAKAIGAKRHTESHGGDSANYLISVPGDKTKAAVDVMKKNGWEIDPKDSFEGSTTLRRPRGHEFDLADVTLVGNGKKTQVSMSVVGEQKRIRPRRSPKGASMKFRAAYNPHHDSKSGKFSSKGGGGAGATGKGSGTVVGGPGGPSLSTKKTFAPGSPGDVVQRALPGRKILGVNERKFDADVLTEHTETFGGKTKKVKSTVQMLKVGDKWGIGDENAMPSVFKKNGGTLLADAGTKVGGPGGMVFRSKKKPSATVPVKG